jgi:hypothetical protein
METPTGVPTDTALLTDEAADEFRKRRNSLRGPSVNTLALYANRKSPFTIRQKKGKPDDVSLQGMMNGTAATPVNLPKEEAKPSQSIQNIAIAERGQENPLKRPQIIRPKKRTTGTGTGTGTGGYASRRSGRSGIGGAADPPRHQFTVRRR